MYKTRLSPALDSFRVTLRRDDPARFLHLAGDPQAALRSSLHNLDLAPGYAAALAYCDTPRKLRSIAPRDAGDALGMLAS